jgi:transposase
LGFRGVLQVDGYAGYGALAETGTVQLAFCWAHWRRRFYEIAQAGNAPIPTEALTRVAGIYAIEADIRGQDAEARHTARHQRTKPLVDGFKIWLEAQLTAVSRKSTIAEAIRYGLGRWDGLLRFLNDGRIEIDSNIVERAIRPVALNRKNALFAGSDGGGEHWAILASLIETTKLNSIDPQACLAHILTRIANGHPISRIDELLPWTWATNR